MALPAAVSAVLCALVVLTVSGTPAGACLLCFTSYTERLRICQTFAGMEGPELEKCEAAFTAAFGGLLDAEISEEIAPPSSGVLGGVCRGRDQRGLETPRLRETRMGEQRPRGDGGGRGGGAQRQEDGDGGHGDSELQTVS
ncbi:sperm acrosome membrane-associated protein 6-like [Pteropus alecto]|uniref:sperm acrosome membrane-associated protein 6-like n=1 Tax=Pteropus alecto TaxID=9402 RepID=UPI000D539E5E|nr:sperm acrosome membrane-associated protein 6-like [Pteropus alecto]